MAFVVVYDACVLYPAPVRDLLLRMAVTGLVRARWSEEILDEVFRNLASNRPELTREALGRTRNLMNQAVPDCIVSGYQSLLPDIELPDSNDRHVLAAAVRSGAQAIVTFNLKDFPSSALARYEIEAKHPDDFVLDAIGLAPGLVLQAVGDQAAALKSPPVPLARLLDTLRDCGLEQSVARMRELFG
jgi:predicted nucleic acid-binding protein